MKKRSTRHPFLVHLILVGVASASLFADTSTVTIYPDSLRQRIAGIGGNMTCGDYAGGGVMDSVGRFLLKNLSPAPIIRVSMPLRRWEPVNDDTLANNFNWGSFQDTGYVHNYFLGLKTLKETHGIKTIIASVWDVPNFLDTFISGRSQRVTMDKWPELIECMASMLVRARDTYGVTIDYVSFNEPDLFVSFSGTDLMRFTRQAGPRFVALGLSTKWLGGDYSKPAGFLSNIYPLADDATAMQYIGPLSYHSWRQEEAAHAAAPAQIGSLRLRYNREIWVAECEWNPDSRPDLWPTWDYAWKLSANAYRCLHLAQASALLHWAYNRWCLTMVKYDPVDSRITPYPMFYVWKNIVDNMLPGTWIMKTVSSDTMIWPLSGKNDSLNHFMVQLMNRDTLSARTVTVSGIPAGISELYQYRTKNNEYLALVDSFTVASGTATLTLPPQSINTLRKGMVRPAANTISAAKTGNGGFDLTVKPNPFNPSTTIQWTVPARGGAQETGILLEIYNSQGRLVKSLINGTVKANSYKTTWDGTGMAGEKVGSGVFFCRWSNGKIVLQHKLILAR